MATLKDVTDMFIFLGSLYPRYTARKATIKAYHRVLGDIPTDALVAATEQLGADSTFFPAAAEIRKLAFKLMQGDNLPVAIEGWNQLLDHWNGRYVEFHPLTQKTIKTMGGLRHLGLTTNDQLPFVRNQFVKAFDTFREREVIDRRQLPAVREFKTLQAGKVDEQIKRLAEKYRKDK